LDTTTSTCYAVKINVDALYTINEVDKNNFYNNIKTHVWHAMKVKGRTME